MATSVKIGCMLIQDLRAENFQLCWLSSPIFKTWPGKKFYKMTCNLNTTAFLVNNIKNYLQEAHEKQSCETFLQGDSKKNL